MVKKERKKREGAVNEGSFMLSLAQFLGLLRLPGLYLLYLNKIMTGLYPWIRSVCQQEPSLDWTDSNL